MDTGTDPKAQTRWAGKSNSGAVNESSKHTKGHGLEPCCSGSGSGTSIDSSDDEEFDGVPAFAISFNIAKGA